MPSGAGSGTKPIHNKQKKKAAQAYDEDDLAFLEKQRADKKAQADATKAMQAGGKLGAGLKKSTKK